jgi:HEAT repeat protein
MKNASEILKSGLTYVDPLVNAEAARLIGDWNVRALIPELIEHARFHRFYSKVAAFYSLARMSATEAIPHLKALVDDPNVSNDWYWTGYKGVRAAAAVSLLQLGNDAGVPYLLESAKAGQSVFFRWFAPALLRLKTPPPELVGYLTLENLCSSDAQKRLRDTAYSEPGMLCMLCEALGVIGDPAAEERLEFYLGHYSRFVRGQAYRSLYLRRPDKATAQKIGENAKKFGTDFDRLVAAEVQKDSVTLSDIARHAPAAFDRGSAIDALAAISSPALTEAGKLALEDADLYVRQCAVEALAHYQGAAAQKYFTGLIESEQEIRVLCALAAAQLGEKGAA